MVDLFSIQEVGLEPTNFCFWDKKVYQLPHSCLSRRRGNRTHSGHLAMSFTDSPVYFSGLPSDINFNYIWVRICTLHEQKGSNVLRKPRIKRLLPYKRLPIPPSYIINIFNRIYWPNCGDGSRTRYLLLMRQTVIFRFTPPRTACWGTAPLFLYYLLIYSYPWFLYTFRG